jgi:TonB family protein
MLAAPVVQAQPADPKAAQNAINWEIFQKLYPPGALAAHEEGAVGFKVTLDSKGSVTDCQVTHSSGHPLLDEETCKVVTMHAQFNPDPNISASQTRTHDGLIAWKLPGWAATLEPPKPIPAVAAPEKLVCKKTLKIGSLASYERTCLTPTEWAKQSDAQKQPFAEVQGKKGSTSGVSCIGPSGC